MNIVIHTAETQRKYKKHLAAKTQRAQTKSLLWLFNLRIFATLAAEKYFFSAPQRLCG
jgi:hypothetical protein